MNEISNRMRILVTFANTYDMPAEVGRDAMKGCTVQYFFLGESGAGMQPVQEWDVSLPVGYQRSKVSLDFAKRAKISVAPAIYDGTFEMVVGGDGKPVAKLVDVDYVEDFNVRDLLKLKRDKENKEESKAAFKEAKA